MVEAAEKTKKLKDEIAETTRSLEMEAATLGMTADEAKLYKLQLQGATDEQLAQARGLMQMKNAFEERKKLLEDAKQVTKEFADPQQKHNDRINDLQKMLDAGAISQETFNRAVMAARKEMAGLNQELSTFDAAAAGSAEAAARMEAFRERLRAAGGDGAALALGRAPEPARLPGAQGMGLEPLVPRGANGAVLDRAAPETERIAEPARIEGAQLKGPEPTTRRDNTEGLLREIRDLIRRQVERPSLEVLPAQLES
jgi:hypothetical protein